MIPISSYIKKIFGVSVVAGMAMFVLSMPLGNTQILLAANIPSEMPPFPIVYSGKAFVDGKHLDKDAKLVARMDGYEIFTFVEVEGRYRNLVVGPPEDSFYNKKITFHFGELTAQEKDVFLELDFPIFKDHDFNLHFFTGTQQQRDDHLWTDETRNLLIGGILIIATLGGWVFLNKRLRDYTK